ncbi:hypothetical protein BH10ACI2_BH10ACI2_09590 [soil metagenome]
MKALFLFTLLILSFQTAFGQADVIVAKTGLDDVYLAKDNGEGKAGDQANSFKTTDIPIYCVVVLHSGAAAVVKMNFVAVSVVGVKPESNVVTTSYSTKEGQNRVNFTGRPDGKWTPGKYRVDLFVDGKLARNIEFEIKVSAGTVTTAKYLQPPVSQKLKPAKAISKKLPQ